MVNVHLNQLMWFHFLILAGGFIIRYFRYPLIIPIGLMIFLLPFLYVIRISMLTGPLHAQLDYGILCLQNTFL